MYIRFFKRYEIWVLVKVVWFTWQHQPRIRTYTAYIPVPHVQFCAFYDKNYTSKHVLMYLQTPFRFFENDIIHIHAQIPFFVTDIIHTHAQIPCFCSWLKFLFLLLTSYISMLKFLFLTLTFWLWAERTAGNSAFWVGPALEGGTEHALHVHTCTHGPAPAQGACCACAHPPALSPKCQS